MAKRQITRNNDDGEDEKYKEAQEDDKIGICTFVPQFPHTAKY